MVKNKGGRPPKELDKAAFEKLCSMQCTESEICSFFDVDDMTLNAWCKRTYKKGFSEVFAVKRGQGKISLRRSQWKLAETNPTMAIWLGKQYLGQHDQIKMDVKQTITQEVIMEVDELINGIE